MTNRRTAVACLALVALAVTLGATTTHADPWPARITDDMTAVQANETSLAVNPGDTAAYGDCLGHVAVYNADTATAPDSIPAGLPQHLDPTDACGPKPGPATAT